MDINLNPGGRIEYTRKLSRNRTKDCKGVIIQVTDKHITVDLGKYKDSFQVCDIGKSVIITFPALKLTQKEEEELAKKIQTLPKVTTDDLRKLWIDGGYRVNPIAKHFNISWIYAEELLRQHNLLDEKPVHEGYPIMVKGHVDWSVMWPLCKAELDKGTDKEEVAEMFNIPLSVIKSRIKYIKRYQKEAEEGVPEPTPPAKNVEAVVEEPKIVCSKCDRDIDAAEMHAVDNDTKDATCFDCISQTMTPEDILTAEIEVTEDPPLNYDGLKISPELMKIRKANLIEEAQRIDDAMQLVDLCLYWYDQGRQDKKEGTA